MRNPNSSRLRRLGAVLSLVGLLTLVGAACKEVQPPGQDVFSPTGSLDLVAGGTGEVRVAGWASQWDLFVDGASRDQGPVQIVVNLNGTWVKGAVPADGRRMDVHWVLGVNGFGPIMQKDMGYGFDFTVPAPSGRATVCVAAINQNLDLELVRAVGGDHVLLGCRTVTVS